MSGVVNVVDFARARLLPIDDHVAMAENHDLAFGDFLEALCRLVWRLHLFDHGDDPRGDRPPSSGRVRATSKLVERARSVFGSLCSEDLGEVLE